MSNHYQLACILIALLASRKPHQQHIITESKHLTPAQRDHLLGLLLPDSSRNATFLQLMVEIGCRPTEACKVRLCDVYLESNFVLIRALKRGRDRQMPLSANLSVKLASLISQRETAGASLDDNLFTFGYHTARRIWLYYRPVTKQLKSTRHTFAIDLYAASKDIQLVKSCLGHVSINSTMVYAEYSYSINERQQALASGKAGWRDYGSKKKTS